MGKGTIRSEKNIWRFLHRAVAKRSPDVLAQSVSPLRIPFPSYTQTCTDHRALPERRYCRSKINFRFTRNTTPTVSVYPFQSRNRLLRPIGVPVMQGNVIRIAMLKKLNTSATLTLCLNKKNTIGQNMEVGL